jgi:hypothetical protein
MAGDRGAAKAIYGQSKVYLEIDSVPMVARIVLTLQSVSEVDEVWVVGDSERLEAVFADANIRQAIHKPLHITPQHANLYENAWFTYQRALPGAGPDGRLPEGDDLDFQVIYLSSDLPFATPREISSFIEAGLVLDCDYALGLVTESSVDAYNSNTPVSQGGPKSDGLDIAFFNLRDGRVRQNNLHLAKAARILNRKYVQDMYRYRHMRAFGSMLGMASKLLVREGGFAILYFYLVMHFAGLADRKGYGRLARMIRYGVTLKINEWGVSKLLNCDFHFVVSEIGGCAIDVDTEEEYEAIQRNFTAWSALETERVTALLGPPAPESVAGKGG